MGPATTSSSPAGEPGFLSRLIRRASMRRSNGSIAAINNFEDASAAAAGRGAPPTNTGPSPGGASEVQGTAPSRRADDVYALRRPVDTVRSKLHKIDEGSAASPSSAPKEAPLPAPVVVDDGLPLRKKFMFRHQSLLLTKPTATPAATTTMALPSTMQSTKLRSKPSFRNRFWAASSSNDFGNDIDNKGNVAAAKSTTPRTAYVPRHAASDFSETTAANRRHHRAVSHDSATDDERNRQQQDVKCIDARRRSHGSQYEAMAHRGASFHARVAAGRKRENENPFLVASEKALAGAASQPFNATKEGEDTFTDYDRFVARAHAEEMAMRVNAVRRKRRESKRDSACYSGKRDSPRTSDEESGSSSIDDAIVVKSPGIVHPIAGPGLRRQSSIVAQRISQYIRPPREEAVVRVERPVGRMGIVREV
ncbi:uncharacterized protein VDAG_08256 [Verticillium dahliae VdLs.17]|uniref:Uncharacterized protein n=1 Tax=Verticillium dahliae (strain VdLs.17 / ATCC MYA-4575 / FGSC 10137) TaxID=498257 RepID=G2XDM4_VERDV|nr:uncharacterized protein VDAG_08256 [Verticillium dahliae VdLs.17]EGY17092.1 hypothetical protein VDAG_08256 [Verticillium dahliae VdLs.17]